MAEIMQQCCKTDQPSMIVIDLEAMTHSRSNLSDAQRVVETGMERARIYHVSHGQLMNATFASERIHELGRELPALDSSQQRL